MIRPVLIDREMPRLQARLDELNKISDAHKADPNAPALTADQQKEFIEVTSQLKAARRSAAADPGADGR